MGKKGTTESFILAATKKHGNEYDYSKVFYVGSAINVIIIHPKCGNEYPQRPNNHLNGAGCPYCVVKGKVKDSFNDFKVKARRMHGDAYDYSLANYVDSTTEILIIHRKCGMEFWKAPNQHVAGSGCPCFGNFLKTTEGFISDAVAVHGDEYDYSEVDYQGKDIKVIIRHKTCDRKFEQTPHGHLHGRRCTPCFQPKSKTTEQIIKESKAIHGDEYDYSKTIHKSTKIKMIIIHPKCGRDINMSSNEHIGLKRGCQFCFGPITNLEQFIFRSNQTHKNEYDYSEVVFGSAHDKIWLTHKKCRYRWQQVMCAHTYGIGCPNCKTSKGETFIGEYLEKMKVGFEVEKRFSDCRNKMSLPFDFYIPDRNLLIEFDGKQHYMPIKFFGGRKGFEYRVFNDNIKNEYCETNKINLHRIKYDDDIESTMKYIYDLYLNPDNLAVMDPEEVSVYNMVINEVGSEIICEIAE